MPNGFDEVGAGEFSTWSNVTTAPPMTLERLQAAFRWYTDREAMRDVAGVFWPSQSTVCFSYRAPEMTEADEATDDNVTQELLDLVKREDRAGFEALAGCVMPVAEIEACWHGARARFGL